MILKDGDNDDKIIMMEKYDEKEKKCKKGVKNHKDEIGKASAMKAWSFLMAQMI